METGQIFGKGSSTIVADGLPDEDVGEEDEDDGVDDVIRGGNGWTRAGKDPPGPHIPLSSFLTGLQGAMLGTRMDTAAVLLSSQPCSRD